MLVYRLEIKELPVEMTNDNVCSYVGINAGIYTTSYKAHNYPTGSNSIGSYLDGYLGNYGSIEYDVTHPAPWEDRKLRSRGVNYDWMYSNENYICCFESISQLRNWFSEIDKVSGLEDHIRIAIYEVDDSDIISGLTQSLIDSFKIKLVGVLDPYVKNI